MEEGDEGEMSEERERPSERDASLPKPIGIRPAGWTQPSAQGPVEEGTREVEE